MILVIGNIKGGVGKTTLAINIVIARALSGRDVLLIDGDDQKTASEFTELRTAICGRAGYTSIRLSGASIRNEVFNLAEKYDDIIIDVGGRDTGSLRAALTVAEKILIPIQPRSFDIWAVAQVAELIREARSVNDIAAFSMLNSADAQGKDNEEAAEYLRGFDGIEFLPIMVGRRKAFPNAASNGRAVIEHMPRDEKAIKELQELVSLIYSGEVCYGNRKAA